ncbi:unnamed protein product [Oreochromis niloticus]|nr:unnamed protein product [Mustela putorius furo]
MAAYGLSFESASSIDERKEKKRQARQEALEKAKQQYDKEQRRKELKRQRGEDTWMLPEVNERLQQIEDEGSVKSKKKKEKKSKKKKEKKKAKKEKKAAETADGSSDSSQDSEDEWVELQPQTQTKAWQVPSESKPSESDVSPTQNVQRDEWMTFDFLAMKTTSTADRRAEKERQKEEERAKAQAIEQAGLHKLELNPYWKDGGTGLPPEEMTGSAANKGPVVNDGGLSWLRKSYQRMKEQAEREQRSLSDVVAERYGSMEEFQQRLAEAEEAMYGQKKREGDDTSRAPQRLPPPARPSRGFLKPSSDDEDSGPQTSRAPAWKKSSSPACESDTSDKPQQENKRDAEKTVTAPQPAAPPRAESESEEEEEEEEVPLLSEEELNKLGSKLIKAEIMGNTAVIEKLKSQLEAAHKAKEKHAARKKLQEAAKSNQASDGTSEDREILLFRTDESGRAWPVNAPSGPQEPHGGRRKKKPMETHVDGERVRYFQDDDNVGLKEMVRREKMSSAQDQNALYSRMAAKMMGKTDGDNYTLDDMFVSSAAQREGEGREEERMRNRAIGESRRLAASMEKCQHCFSSKELQKHLIVAIGSKVYLSLPAGVSMTEGHCLICPLQHHCSATSMDEDIWSEMQLFRRTLVRMFEAQELDCVFMETHMNPRRRQHMVLECIPLPKELGDMAPIYFKKAIMECDEEWAMNKKVVDLSSKSIRQAVPRSLPYFAVDFGLQGGFAHVIENEQKFPHYFGKEVVGGMLDLEPRRWRKMIKENFDDQRKKVLQFAQWWKPYDCTKTQG